MSLESALDEERKAVMALLEGRTARSPSSTGMRTSSPVGAVRSPVRSMLDIGDGSLASPRSPSNTPLVRSMLDVDVAAPLNSPRSMLDIASPRSASHTRSSKSPPPIGARHGLGSPLANTTLESAYNFEMLPTIESHALPKRVGQGGNPKRSTMAQIFGSSTAGSSRDMGRHNSTAGILGQRRTMSPSSRINALGRSSSPAGKLLTSSSNQYRTDSGKSIDLNSAYRKLSDAALLRSGGSLSELPMRKGGSDSNGQQIAPDGGVRLEKDYDDEEAVESSDEELSDDLSSDDDAWGEKGRGRRRRRKDSQSTGDESGTDSARKPIKSLLAAAEEERKTISSKQQYRSLLEPVINVTDADGKPTTPKRTGVHPNTSFDQGSASGVSTPVDSDTEADLSDLRRAQRLAMTVSPVHSTPAAHRCVKQIIRGEYSRFLEEAEHGLRRQRVYLVATDLSDEAAYALEWTIGTVLRDGDTLLAVYAVDEEVGTGGETSGIGIGEGGKAFQEANSIVKTLSNEKVLSSQGTPLLGPRDGRAADSRPHTSAATDEKPPDFSNMNKAERERWHATMEVADRCVKLLRKTKLQCRVIVEVFHCKSPKHMITEVIDYLEPTLVILGSRGRSALKGVLLGSFSNYLVSKSSVPVMVARKRLRKHSKYKRTNIRMSNLLSPANNKLQNAKID